MMNDDGSFFFLSHGYQIEGSWWYPDETPSDLEDEVLCLSFISGRAGLYGLTVAKVEGRDDEYVRTGVFNIVGHGRYAMHNLPPDWLPEIPPFSDLRPIDEEDEDEDIQNFYLV
jgi:hypothetical protein